VVESNVHFPTDYNLLWDSARKCLESIAHLQKKHDLPGWRKASNWGRDLKNKMRALGRAGASGGKGKEKRVKNAAQLCLEKAKALPKKLECSKAATPPDIKAEVKRLTELESFMKFLHKRIDLLERRIIESETIPHCKKMFSIFEDYTEWIAKGKMRPNVELGKKIGITTDQFNLIVDYQIMEHRADSKIVPELAQRMFSQYQVESWSFDKGYWHKNNKALLSEKVEWLVLPKKGKLNAEEAEHQGTPVFKKLRNKHSAVESNINELEHRGLNRCPDRGYSNFKRYVGLAVCAFNLRKSSVASSQKGRLKRLKT